MTVRGGCYFRDGEVEFDMSRSGGSVVALLLLGVPRRLFRLTDDGILSDRRINDRPHPQNTRAQLLSLTHMLSVYHKIVSIHSF